jgi:hypothetical protein
MRVNRARSRPGSNSGGLFHRSQSRTIVNHDEPGFMQRGRELAIQQYDRAFVELAAHVWSIEEIVGTLGLRGFYEEQTRRRGHEHYCGSLSRSRIRDGHAECSHGRRLWLMHWRRTWLGIQRRPTKLTHYHIIEEIYPAIPSSGKDLLQ